VKRGWVHMEKRGRKVGGASWLREREVHVVTRHKGRELMTTSTGRYRQGEALQ
jgi:hypothetical protein